MLVHDVPEECDRSPCESPGLSGKGVPSELLPNRDHGRNMHTGDNPHVNTDRTPSDAVRTITGDCAPPGLCAGSHMLHYLTDVVACVLGLEGVCLTITGNDARPGGSAAARLGAITGDDAATGVGLAAIKDTLLYLAVAGNLRYATCKTIDVDCEHREGKVVEHCVRKDLSQNSV